MNEMTFGKYKGIDVNNVPINYLEWLYRSMVLFKVNPPLKVKIGMRLVNEDKIEPLSEDLCVKLLEDERKYLENKNFKHNWKCFPEEPKEYSNVITKPYKRRLLFREGKFYTNHGLTVSRDLIKAWSYCYVL
jgi:uncharacterized protein (DUF3820 family)